MMTAYEQEAKKFLAEQQGQILANAEYQAQCREFVEGLRAKMYETPLELARREVEETLESIFACSWHQEMQGISLTTTFSERLGATKKAEPNTLAVHVDDMQFDSDPSLYAAQLAGAAIKVIAGILLDHDPDKQPTEEFLSVAAELTRTVSLEMGRIPPRFVIDTEKFGLSRFENYVAAAREGQTQTLQFAPLERYVTASICPRVTYLFLQDGGPLKLVDPEVLRGSLTDEENNAIGRAEVVCDFAERDRILATASRNVLLAIPK